MEQSHLSTPPPTEISIKNQIRAKRIVDGLHQGSTYTQIAKELELSRTQLYAVMARDDVQKLMIAEVTEMETSLKRMILNLDKSTLPSDRRHAATELGKIIRHTKDKLYPTIFQHQNLNINVDLQAHQTMRHILMETMNRLPPSIRTIFRDTYNQVKQEYNPT